MGASVIDAAHDVRRRNGGSRSEAILPRDVGVVAANSWDAQSYDAQFGFVSRYDDDLLTVLDPLPGEAILDLGRGRGPHAAEIAERGAAVVSVDADLDMLAKARADHPGIEFVAVDATTAVLANVVAAAPFDACFSAADPSR